MPSHCLYIAWPRLLGSALPYDIPAWIALALAAPFIGSFLGVLAMRLPERRPVLLGRSQCDHCGHGLSARDLIPFASWALSARHCRYCGAKLGLFYPAIEFCAVVAVLWAATATSGWILAASCLFGWQLLALSFADWRTGLLPDALNAVLLLSGLAVAYAIDPAILVDHLIGGAVGFLFLAALAWIYRRLRGRDGLGLGDAKLLAGLGAWLSWNGLPSVILFASALALFYAVLRSLSGKPLSGSDKLAFGPFLAMGGWLVWLYGPLAVT
jgi:leader peptidase (prepilin peptidase)/N-methyltransferase